MTIKRNAAWLDEQERAARRMRLKTLKAQIKAGTYKETPAKLAAVVAGLIRDLNR